MKFKKTTNLRPLATDQQFHLKRSSVQIREHDVNILVSTRNEHNVTRKRKFCVFSFRAIELYYDEDIASGTGGQYNSAKVSPTYQSNGQR